MIFEESTCLDIFTDIDKHFFDRHHYNLNKFCEASNSNYQNVEKEVVDMTHDAFQFLEKIELEDATQKNIRKCASMFA